MIGPIIQNTLILHLLRLCTYRYVIIVDIEKMYRQVQVHEDDHLYRRILWRVNRKICTFQMNTLTFGISSSPFLAIRTVQQLAADECEQYPKAAEALSKHLYIDDLMSGANSIAEVRIIRDEIIVALKRDGFIMRQWASNEDRIINDLESNRFTRISPRMQIGY